MNRFEDLRKALAHPALVADGTTLYCHEAWQEFERCCTPKFLAELLKRSDAVDGLPDGALDGGWTAAGMSAYTARLEQALKPFADHPEFHAPDDFPVTILRRLEPTGEPVAGVTAGDFRRAKAAMRHNDPNSGAARSLIAGGPLE